MTAADTFDRAWILGWTLLVLPLSCALLRGWAPAWLRRCATPRMLRARGIGGLILWASAVASVVTRWVGLPTGDRYPLTLLAGPVAVLAAVLLVGVTDVAERRRRRKAFPTSQ
ncbi:hypothetical protein [Streptomyces sp. HB132]|uniref:hypothetical protein n=1 Tax=Streptomyces sp. HB132 TaxID=767388 RepID=UPI00195FA310|nr:hypothetical protein [Streptomyces sp. HB132]MBM7438613.1 hypothetical protein [Streptomyces sp. HB132]